MMSNYKRESSYRTPVMLLHGTYDNQDGFNSKVYSETNTIINVSAKSYGGTKKVVNDIVVIEDTYVIETWYRPDITSSDAIKFMDDNSIYEIISPPENIDRANQILLFKVRRYVGGA